jgi:hypothetical protein
VNWNRKRKAIAYVALALGVGAGYTCFLLVNYLIELVPFTWLRLILIPVVFVLIVLSIMVMPLAFYSNFYCWITRERCGDDFVGLFFESLLLPVIKKRSLEMRIEPCSRNQDPATSETD